MKRSAAGPLTLHSRLLESFIANTIRNAITTAVVAYSFFPDCLMAALIARISRKPRGETGGEESCLLFYVQFCSLYPTTSPARPTFAHHTHTHALRAAREPAGRLPLRRGAARRFESTKLN